MYEGASIILYVYIEIIFVKRGNFTQNLHLFIFNRWFHSLNIPESGWGGGIGCELWNYKGRSGSQNEGFEKVYKNVGLLMKTLT